MSNQSKRLGFLAAAFGGGPEKTGGSGKQKRAYGSGYKAYSKGQSRGGGNSGDTGHWITVNGHHIYVQDGGPGAQKGHIEHSPHAPTSTAPTSKELAKGHAPRKGWTTMDEINRQNAADR